MRLFDHHSHIADGIFEHNTSEIIEEAKIAGISHILIPSCDEKTSKLAVNAANKYENVFCAVGTHPHEAKYLNKNTIETYRNLAKSNKKVVAIGEIGLDYHYNNSDPDLQKEAFVKQIHLAKELNLPVIIHSRDARQDTIDILGRENAYDTGVIIHCFSEDRKTAKLYVSKGAYISFSGVLTYKNATELVETAKEIPLENVLIETDSPYLTPIPYRGKTNKPCYLRLTCAFLAKVLDKSVEEISEITFQNTCKAYKLDKKGLVNE